uniref:MAK10-like protein n=1 Tax=Tanacetum cinerariifolium TaxID=118510 RepID=A0A6L2KAH9_TANCI|nr:MAK10-like protein [Tanacetum cinerariifolium]
MEDLSLYDNESWNDPRDFAKPVNEISLPQDVSSTSDRRLIELENQVQRLMEAHLALKPSVQVNKIPSSCEICSGTHDTQYCMKNHKQALVDYASSRNNGVGGFLYDGYSLDAITNSLTRSLGNPNGIASIPGAVSTFYVTSSLTCVTRMYLLPFIAKDVRSVKVIFVNFSCSCGNPIVSSRGTTMTLMQDLGGHFSSDAPMNNLISTLFKKEGFIPEIMPHIPDFGFGEFPQFWILKPGEMIGYGNPTRALGYYSIPSHEGYRNTIEIPDGKNVVPLRFDTIRLMQNGCSFHRLRSKDPNQHLKDFSKLVYSLDLDVANRERTRLSISTQEDLTTHFLAQFFPLGRTAKLHNDILMFQQHQGKLRDRNAKESWALLVDLTLYDNESWNDPMDFAKPVKAISLPQDALSTSDLNKIASSCEICGGPHDTQYCMENPEQAFVDYPSSRTDEVGGKWYTFKPEQNNLGDTYNPSWKSHPNLRLSKFEADFKQQQSKMTNKIDTFLKAINDRMMGALPSDMVKNPKLSDNFTFPVLSARSYPTRDPQCLTQIHDLINTIMMCSRQPNKSYNDQPQGHDTTPIMRRQLEPKEDLEGIKGICNFTGRVKGMHIFVGNLTYVSDFMIIKDISSIIDPRLLQVVLGNPFVEISNMTHDLSLRVVRFTNRIDEIAYKMPHKIKQYNSLLDLEKEHTKTIYF